MYKDLNFRWCQSNQSTYLTTDQNTDLFSSYLCPKYILYIPPYPKMKVDIYIEFMEPQKWDSYELFSMTEH